MVGQYNGSSNIETSVSNQELVQLQSPYFSFAKFSFINDQACTVKINGSDPIYLRANQGVDIDRGDYAVSSFKIIESGITFNWIGEVR